ncbi:MAG TPA: glycosyltransferase [Gemmatimonadales bacterium]|nr:glycosyltransferase [Gemmatimonadales bacterium]
MSQGGGRGFLDAAASAFLRRRLLHQRLRAAAVRGLKAVSAEAGGRLQMNFDHAADCFSHLPSWLAAHASEVAAAPAEDESPHVPRLSIVIMIVGSRGDVQPFIPIGRRLAERHRVRIATHREFRSMVEHAGLEFYPLGGDPHALMEYIVKTGGRIVPTHLDQIVEDVPKKRAMIAEILASTWRACTEADPARPDAPAFRADVILSNPPSYGHIHCAEALHVPLHMIFTMPWTATTAVPHPFAGIDPGADRRVENFLSYGLIDLLIWGGIADLVNAFREETLKLAPIALADGAALLDDNEVPFTYLWPPSLVPKPADWGPHIDLANFTFYDQARTYDSPRALLDFLAAGEAPIYIGFGSVVVEDPAALRRIIFTALEKARARGIVSDGWAHLGGAAPPPNVCLIGDTPHDWLFARCRAVCHHGGAGTTAAGLRAGLPTVVVPFFGDQFFWGRVIADAGAGPEPIPIHRLDSDRLAEAFEMCRHAQVRERAAALGTAVRETDGVELVVRSLYRHLPARAMCCARDPDHLATVYCDTCDQRLCLDCSRAVHSGHAIHPYGYVDWSVHPRRGLAEEMGELIGDAVRALEVGLEEIMPKRGPWRHGVIFHDAGGPSNPDVEGPVRKPERSYRSPRIPPGPTGAEDTP